MVSTEFLLTSLLVVLVPGTGVIYTISKGLSQDWKASLFAALGCTAGIFPHLIVSILGLTYILDLSARIFQVIRYAGALYLLYLAWGMWRDSGSLKLETSLNQLQPGQVVVKAILINLLNPKLTIFFLSFLPLFLNPEAGSISHQMIGLSAVFMLMTLLIFSLYGILASKLQILLQSSLAFRNVQRSFAVLLSAMAVKLAVSE